MVVQAFRFIESTPTYHGQKHGWEQYAVACQEKDGVGFQDQHHHDYDRSSRHQLDEEQNRIARSFVFSCRVQAFPEPHEGQVIADGQSAADQGRPQAQIPL